MSCSRPRGRPARREEKIPQKGLGSPMAAIKGLPVALGNRLGWPIVTKHATTQRVTGLLIAIALPTQAESAAVAGVAQAWTTMHGSTGAGCAHLVAAAAGRRIATSGGGNEVGAPGAG